MKMLVFLHISHLNTPEGEFITSDKLDAIIKVCRASDFELKFVVSGKKNRKLMKKNPYLPVLPFVGNKEILRESVIDLFTKDRIPEFFANPKKKAGLNPRRKELRHFWFENTWKKLLSENQIKVVMGIGLTPALISASRKLGIRTVEVQHGTLTKSTAKKYWENSQPDVFLSWDPYSSQNAQNFIGDVRQLGHPISDYDTLQTPDVFRQGQPSPKFCVALQYKRCGVFKIPWISPKLVQILRNQDLICGSELIFRIHPVIDSKAPQRLILMITLFFKFPKSQIHRPRKIPLKDTILATSALLTDSSTVAYEYGLLGKPSLVLDCHMKSAFKTFFSQSGLHKDLIHDQIESFTMAARRDSRKKRGGFNKSVIQELLRENM